jgi:opacity protein-like surface antigen
MVRPRGPDGAAAADPGGTSMTKKIAALGLALLLPTLASASSSLNPGALQLSGTTSFDWGKTSFDTDGGDSDETRIGAELSAMYFVSHFLAFGLETGYDHLEQDDDSYASSFFFGPKAGIDWGLMNKLSVFGDFAIGIARGETKDGAGNIDTADGFGYGLSAGLRLFLNRNVSLDLFGAFEQLRFDFPTAGKVTVSDLSMGVGISVYLTNNPANAEGYRPPPPAY